MFRKGVEFCNLPVIYMEFRGCMREQSAIVTRRGRVTIPLPVREALNIKEGDRLVWLLEEGQVRIMRAASVVARTAGMLKSSRSIFTVDEERAAVEQAIAEEAEERSAS
jgi:antitoxin PrlF